MISLNVRHSAMLLALLTWTASAAETFTLEVRLQTALTSRHGGNSEIAAELMQPVTRDGQILMPVHSRVFGHVRRASSVGIGLRRERASLDVAFTSWETPEGTREPLDATLLHIDNAREQVDARGRIHGILAASNPLGIARGLWLRPNLRLLRTPAGFGGASWLHLAMGPAGASGMLAARLLLTRMPDPEIELPAGTEMTLQVYCAALDRTWGSTAAMESPEESLVTFLQQQPTAISKTDMSFVADVINVALEGPRETVQQAFAAAGWSAAVDLDRKSFARTYKAFTQRQGYAEAPVSKLYYQGRLPDLVFQKSLNSIAKRHHVRLWKVVGPGGQDLWLGAATHDVTVGFNSKNFGLLHVIDMNLDRERQKVLSDLEFAGATSGAALIPRELILDPGAQSDGALAWMTLRAPSIATPLEQVAPAKASVAQRFTRRLVLEGRQYLLRDNPYYLAFAAGRKLLRKSPPQVSE